MQVVGTIAPLESKETIVRFAELMDMIQIDKVLAIGDWITGTDED